MGYLSGFIVMASNVPITVSHGDGIGPEIMAATLPIMPPPRGFSSGVEPGSWHVDEAGLDFTKIENLRNFAGKRGDSLSQGQ